MKRTLIAVICATLGGFAFSGDGHGCELSTQECLNKQFAYISTTAWDGINVEGLDDHGPVKVHDLAPGGPGDAAGLEVGDVLVSLAGRRLQGMTGQQLAELMKTVAIGDSVPFVVARDGKQTTITVTMAKIPNEVAATWVGRHMMANHAKRNAQF